jgi:hypothetical protein
MYPWSILGLFDLHIPLTELSLQEVLELTDFRSLEVIGKFLPFNMVNKSKYPPRFVSPYLKMQWRWRWFGGQFLAIADKP